MARFFYCLFFFLLFSTHVSAQDSPEEKADALFTKGDFKNALPLYKKLFAFEPDNVEYNYRLALCYINSHTIKNDAVPHLEYISRKRSKDADIWFYLALAYQYTNRFDEAIVAYEKCRSSGSGKNSSKIDRQIENCYNGKELMKYPLNVTFQNLGKSVNSEYPDYYPLVPADESFMLFTSRRPQAPGSFTEMDGYYSSDILIAHPKDGQWINAKEISGFINTGFDEQAVDLTANGKFMVVYIDRLDSGTGNIYLSENGKMGFQKLIKFGKDINEGFETSGSMITTDDMIVFASERNGGFGGRDIYTIRRLPNGQWAVPRNLGSNINTKYNEEFPHLSADGKTLYFASEGHSSIGGFDIFKTEWDESTNAWKAPQNLGFPLNNSYDNMNITYAGDTSQAYISTVREDGFGDLDIYKVKFNEIKNRYCIITGYVSTNDTLGPYIKKTIIASQANVKEPFKFIPIKKNGKYIMALLPGTYNITVKAEGHKDVSFPLVIYDVPFQPEMLKDFKLEPSTGN